MRLNPRPVRGLRQNQNYVKDVTRAKELIDFCGGKIQRAQVQIEKIVAEIRDQGGTESKAEEPNYSEDFGEPSEPEEPPGDSIPF